jgi:glycosyltransferase involved in cell wall biosynthesis
MRQEIPDLEVIVLNDGPEEEETKKIVEKHGAKYVFTGMRHEKGKEVWRVPGFSFNIGAKMAQGDVLVLTCAEIWHEESCLKKLLRPLAVHKLEDGQRGVVSIPTVKDDDGAYLKTVSDGADASGIFDRLKDLRAELPFLMALKKDVYLEMGGYDEDFTGRCYDDDDFTDRLGHHKCVFVKSEARCVHLYHERKTLRKDKDGDRVAFNKKLFLDRRGKVVRNEGRDWGILK